MTVQKKAVRKREGAAAGQLETSPSAGLCFPLSHALRTTITPDLSPIAGERRFGAWQEINVGVASK